MPAGRHGGRDTEGQDHLCRASTLCSSSIFTDAAFACALQLGREACHCLKGRLLPSDFFAVLRDRTQMLWGLEMKMIFHVPLSKMINKATRSCRSPVLTRNMQFLLTAFKGPAVNSVKWNSCRDNIFPMVMLRGHVRRRFMTNNARDLPPGRGHTELCLLYY